MGTGNDDNTWGDLFNQQVIQYIEDALVGRTAKTTTGGATTLTLAECRPRYLDISGLLSSDATFTVPNTKNAWIVCNATTGSFGVLFKTASGTAISVPQGVSLEVYCDGSDNVVRMDAKHIGEIFYSGNSSVPAGALECDGSTISRAGLGIDLFARAGTTWGTGNGTTTFTLPDGKTAGKFIRARTGSVVVGTSQSDQNKAHTHSGSTASTTLSMSGTATSGGSHTHAATVTDPGHTHAPGTNTIPASDQSCGGGGTPVSGPRAQPIPAAFTGITVANASDGAHTHTVDFTGSTASTTVTIASDGGTEARPTNLVGIMCIRI
jgi:microcystin-dependent protein